MVERPFNHISEVKRLKEKFASVPERIIVEGTRGKSSTVIMLEEGIRKNGGRTFAKVTGEEPLLIVHGEKIPLIRGDKHLLLDYDNIPALMEYEFDSIILENQAITPYTMRYIHKLVHPMHVIIPNIRIDHPEGLGSTLKEMARNFAYNARATPGVKDVYYAESIKKVHDIVISELRAVEEKYPDKMNLHDVKIPEMYNHIPGIENVLVAEYFLKENYDADTNLSEKINAIERNLVSKKSPDGINYLNAAKVNDPISFIHLLSYLVRRTDRKIVLVGYLRMDRPDRNEIFEEFLDEFDRKFGDRIYKIYLSGFGCEHFYNILPQNARDKTEINITENDLERICEEAKEGDLEIVTMINRVNPFMDRFVERLEKGG